MKMSIRRFLLIYLFFSITATIFIIAFGNYVLDSQSVNQRLDSWLSQSALIIQGLVSDSPKPEDLLRVQASINAIPEHAKYNFYQEDEVSTIHGFNNKFQFQVWNKDNQLVLHSANSPKIPLSDGKNGYSEKTIDNVLWRVFTYYNPTPKLHVMVAERYDIRRELARRITYDDLFIILFTYPILGFSIWLVIGQRLNSLQRVAKELSQRKPSYLDPVALLAVPEEIKPLVDEINYLFARLSDALEREARFASDAAHELRTPLAALRAQVQVALKTKDTNERADILQKLIHGVDRCTHIVQQLLTLSRMTPEVTTLKDIKLLDIVFLCREITAEQVPLAVEKNIDIEVNTTHEEILMHGNPTAICILLRNLIDNAIRYTPEGGLVQINLEKESHKILLTVIDNGPGIPEELRERVFERFFRILGNKAEGSGLGLAIVQQIAALHGAHLHLETPLAGQGLAVVVEFPRI